LLFNITRTDHGEGSDGRDAVDDDKSIGVIALFEKISPSSDFVMWNKRTESQDQVSKELHSAVLERRQG
jgi:hypothetical protein